MMRDRVLAKPAWRNFLHLEGLHDLPVPALLAADQLFEDIRTTGTTSPTPSDYATWAQRSGMEPCAWLDTLTGAAEVILPSELGNIAAARRLLRPTSPAGCSATSCQKVTGSTWDPCARVPSSRARQVSVHPWDLPEAWQTALRRAAQGLPGKKAAAPAHHILQRMQEKLCQLAWAAREAGLEIGLTEPALRAYLEALEARLRARKHSIRWATLRATVEELYRFARYVGDISDTDLSYLRKRLGRYEVLEKGQDALKFATLLETGNTTLTLLDQADSLLTRAACAKTPAARHRLRNAAAILGLYSIVPLRNADAGLILGKTLIWQSEAWIINTQIRKTRHRSPELLVVPLEPAFGRYVDAVVQGDFDPRYLPALREQACASGHPLILHADGSHTSPTHIPRVFREQTGNSFTTTRTMLHSDQAISRGEQGTRDAMVMAHQTSPQTARKYQARRVRQVAVERVQEAAAARRATLLPTELLTAINVINTKDRTDP
ncbi:hypothetical protein BV509_21370 [Rhodovulum sulfidophilum]|uniref:Phage integrase family protein n=1 Tax=Rhodovulum visakhapatnamense TaxID=364297 RepID=A0ABS1RAU9_9RHOB|nr:hypothetical protein [Rhodovulum visakhapatnamense]MBL3568881.1 hypothetical protein [Rhodovulum visakhapatnamense]MBL3576760.1 hypothetical protein [Rhodovulum visakhapatnamense]OLS42291.1 hypothetical protein BV509_21370 [Rhodovulum sulfidophilum]